MPLGRDGTYVPPSRRNRVAQYGSGTQPKARYAAAGVLRLACSRSCSRWRYGARWMPGNQAYESHKAGDGGSASPAEGRCGLHFLYQPPVQLATPVAGQAAKSAAPWVAPYLDSRLCSIWDEVGAGLTHATEMY
jgi:hypothetical protein